MSKLILYTHPFSRGRTVRWMLEELEVPYDVRVMEFGGSIKSPEYLAINPMGKVPALVHGSVVVTETMAICSYLADQFPDKGLAPSPGSPERGAYYRWLFFIAGPFEMAMSARANGWTIDDNLATSMGCGRSEDVVNTLESALKGRDYLCGRSFSTADLIVGSYLGWSVSQKQIDPRPVFAEYLARVSDREAARRAQALDDALAQQLG